jgi:predicted acetyltransferase
MPELVSPDIKYKESFISSIDAYKEENWERYMSLDPAWLQDHFDEFIEQVQKESRGEGLKEGWVPHTEFWLTEGDQFLGRLDIRHELNGFLHAIGGHIGYDVRRDQRGKGYGHMILELGLQKAKEMGFEKILITCDASNTPSRKVIEKHGGLLENSVTQGEGKPDKNRYWIKI